MKASTIKGIKVLNETYRENSSHTECYSHFTMTTFARKVYFHTWDCNKTTVVYCRFASSYDHMQSLRSFEFEYFWSVHVCESCLLDMLLAKSKIFVLQSINYVRGFKFQAKIFSILQLFPVFNHTEHRLHVFIAIINIWEINMAIAGLKHCGGYENSDRRFGVAGPIILSFSKSFIWFRN